MDIRTSLLQLLPLATLIGSSVMAQSTSFENEKPTCNNYVFNTYMYLTIAISLIIVLTIFFNAIMPNYIMTIYNLGLIMIILVLIIQIILLFALRYLINTISPLEIKKKIAVWVAFITNLALFILPTIQFAIMAEQSGLIISTILLVLLMVVVISAVVFLNPELISTQGMRPYLLVGLIGLAIGYIVPIFACLVTNCNNSFMNNWIYYVAIIAVIIFCFVLIYHTKQVIENSEKCKTPMDADYIKESTNLFMTIVNIFLNLLRARQGRRIR
jgi:FtsH-binding integral membrane protein